MTGRMEEKRREVSLSLIGCSCLVVVAAVAAVFAASKRNQYILKVGWTLDRFLL